MLAEAAPSAHVCVSPVTMRSISHPYSKTACVCRRCSLAPARRLHSPVATGALVGLAFPNKAPSPPNWNMKHCKLVELLSNLNVKHPCTNINTLRTNVNPLSDDFLAKFLRLHTNIWELPDKRVGMPFGLLSFLQCILPQPCLSHLLTPWTPRIRNVWSATLTHAHCATGAEQKFRSEPESTGYEEWSWG